jgi:hypothetical protein
VEQISATTRNIISILESMPVVVLKHDPSGRRTREKVFEELKKLSGNGFSTFEGPEGLAIIADGSARKFLL